MAAATRSSTTSPVATLEATIARGRRVRTPAAQREVAFALASASTNVESHEPLTQKGGIRTLVHLLTQSQDDEVQRFAILALANTSVTALYRLQIANEANALENLVSYLSHETTDRIGKQYCAMAIGNLAANVGNHEAIAKYGGIPALVSILVAAAKDQSMDVGRYAAFALANLVAASANHRKEVVDCSAIEPLIIFSCANDGAVQHQALAVLRGICIAPEYRTRVVQMGILDPLILMARSGNRDLRRAVASTLNCLSTMDENKNEVADRALSTIISLLLSNDDAVEADACCAIANLVEVVDVHPRFFREKGLPPVVSMSKSRTRNNGRDDNHRGTATPITAALASVETKTTCKADACRALANLAANAAIQQELAKEGVIESMIDVLREKRDVDCQKYAVLCIANLATTLAGQIEIVDGGAIGPMASLLNRPPSPTTTPPSPAIADIYKYSALAMANLSATQANHSGIVSTDGALTALYSLSTSSDTMTLYYLACCLANLCSESSNRPKMVEFGGIQPMLVLASHKDSDVHSRAAAALRGLTSCVPVDDDTRCMSFRRDIVQEGGLEPISRLLLSKDLHVLRDATACLCNLSLSDENKCAMAICGAVPPLLAHMQSEDVLIASQSGACLANIAEESGNQSIIAENGGIFPCIAVMKSRFLEVQRECGRLLSNLCACATPEHIQKIMDGGGHESLLSFLLSDDGTCRRVGAFGLGNLCSHEDKHRVSLLRVGILEPLASLARSEDTELELRRFATLTIANLAATTDNHTALIADGILPMLVSLSTSSDADVGNFAAFATSRIAVNPDWRQTVVNEGGLEPILYLARTDDRQVQRSLLPAISSMSFVDSNKIDICNGGGLPVLIADVLSYCVEGDVGDTNNDCSSNKGSNRSKLACCGIANLAERIENQTLIVTSNAIPLLIDALLAPHFSIQREAARALGNLAANVEYAATMVEAGVLSRLAVCLQQRELRCKRMAIFALCNIASNGKLHADILSEPSILDVLAKEVKAVLDPKCQSDMETTRFALLALANLSGRNENHSALCERYLDDIIAYSKCGDLKCRSYAAMALGNFCSVADAERKVEEGGSYDTKRILTTIASTDGVKSLISFAFPAVGDDLESTTSSTQFQAVAGLRGLATDDASRKEIAVQGGLEPLILAATATATSSNTGRAIHQCPLDKELKREVAATMRNLTLSSDAKMMMCQRGLTSALLSLVRIGDPVSQVHAIAALGNLADTGGPVLKRLIDEGCVDVLLNVAAVAGDVYAGSSSAAAAVADEVNAQIARCLSICACYVQIHEVLVTEDCRCIERLVQLSTAAATVSPIKGTKQTFTATGCRRFVSLTIAAIAYKDSNLPRLIQAGVIDALLPLSICTDAGTCRCAAFALHRVALTDEKCSTTPAFVRALVSLLLFDDASTNHQACLAAKALCTSYDGRRQMVDAGGIAPLFQCGRRFILAAEALTTPSAAPSHGIALGEGIREACAALRNLSTSCMEAQLEIGKRGMNGVDFLAAQCSSSENDAAHQACAALANLSEAAPNREILIRKFGILQHLKYAMHVADATSSSQAQETKREVIRAVVNLSSSKYLAPEISAAGVLAFLVNALSSSDLLGQQYSAMAISNLSCHEVNAERIAREGAVGPLLALIKNGLMVSTDDNNAAKEAGEGTAVSLDGEIRNAINAVNTGRFALLALANLASSHLNHPIILKAAADHDDIFVGQVLLPLLVEQSTKPDADTIVSTGVILCIANLASNPANLDTSAKPTLEALRLCLGPLLLLLSNTDSFSSRNRRWCIKALRGMAANDTLRGDILDKGKEGGCGIIMESLFAILRGRGIEEGANTSNEAKLLEVDAVGTICNLSLGGYIGSAIRREVALQTKEEGGGYVGNFITKFLRSGQIMYRLFGAIVLGNAAADADLQDLLLHKNADIVDELIRIDKGVDNGTIIGHETRRCIAYSLCNLAACPLNVPAIVELGGLDLINFLSRKGRKDSGGASANDCGDNDSFADDLVASLATIKKVAASIPKYRGHLVSTGVLDIIDLGIKRQLDSFGQQADAVGSIGSGHQLPLPGVELSCSIMYLLSLNEHNKVSMLKHACTMKNVIALLQASSTNFIEEEGMDAEMKGNEWLPILCQVTRMLANCFENQSLIDDNADLLKVNTLLGLLKLNDALLSREVARLLANMACCTSSHKAIASSTIPEKILGLCQSPDVHTSQSALIGIGNLVLVPRNRLRLLEAGASKILNTVVNKSLASSRGKGGTGLKTQQQLRYAYLALAVLSIDTSHHERLLDDGIAMGIMDVLGQNCIDDDDANNANALALLYVCAGFNLSMLAQNQDNAILLSKTGAASTLIDFLSHSADPNAVGQALVALRSLAFSSDFQRGILRIQSNDTNNVFDALSKAFTLAQRTRAMVWIAREVSACFCELSRHKENKSTLAQNTRSMSVVLDLAHSTDLETARFGLATLANVLEHTVAQERLASPNTKVQIIPFLVHQISKGSGLTVQRKVDTGCTSSKNIASNVDLRREAMRATSNHLSTALCHKSFLDQGGLKALKAVSMLQSFSVCISSCGETLYAMAVAYRKLAANSEMHQHLITVERLEMIFQLLHVGGGPAGAGGIHGEMRTRHQAAMALQELASNECCKLQFVGNGGLKATSQMLMNLIDFDTTGSIGDVVQSDEDFLLPTMTAAVDILRHLSIASRLKDLMIQQDIPMLFTSCIQYATRFCGGSMGRLLPFVLLCATTIANMVEHEEARSAVVVGDALLHLLTLISRQPHAAGADASTPPAIVTIQEEVARAFCSLSYEESNHVTMLNDSTSVQILLELLSSSPTAANFAASALGNLSLSHSGQQKIGDMGGINHLASALNRCTAMASRCLSRLASTIEGECSAKTKEDNGRRMVEAEAGGLLLALVNQLYVCNDTESKDQDKAHEEAKYLATMVLCNLSYNLDNHEQLLKAGSLLESLVALLKSRGSPLCRRYSVLALCHLSLSSRYYEVILDQIESDEKTLSSLINLLQVQGLCQEIDHPSAEFAANFINNMAVVAATRPHLESPLFADTRMISNLIELTSSGILGIKQSSARALYSLSRLSAASELNDGRSVLFNPSTGSEAVASALFALCGNQDDACRRFALMAICNLAVHEKARLLMTRNGGLQTVLRLLSDNDGECRSLACLCVTNLCNSSITQEQVVLHGALDTLQRLATATRTSSNQSCCSNCPAIASMINICANEANHEIILRNSTHSDNGLLPLLVSVAQRQSRHQHGDSSPTAATTSILDHLCAYAIANLICNCSSDRLPAIVGHGGIHPILQLLKNSDNDDGSCSPSTSPHGQWLCLAAVRRLAAASPEYRGILVEGDILNILSLFGARPKHKAWHVEIDCLREASGCLFELTQSPNLRRGVAARCREVLFLAAASVDIETASKSIGAMGNIAEEVELHRGLRDSGIIKLLSSRLSSSALGTSTRTSAGMAIANPFSGGSGHILGETSRTLSNVLSTSPCQVDFVCCGGLGGLLNIVSVKMTSSASSHLNSIARFIAQALRKISFNSTSHGDLVDGLASLYVLMEADDTATAIDATVALRNVSTNDEYKVALVKNGATNRLIDFSRRREVDAKRFAMESLCHIAATFTPDASPLITSRHERIIKDILIDKHCPIVPAIQCIIIPDQDLHRIVARLFAELSEYCRRDQHPSVARTLVANGIVPALISLAQGGGGQDEETRRYCTRSFVNLCSATSEDEQNGDVRFTIYRQGGLDCLLDLMKSDGAGQDSPRSRNGGCSFSDGYRCGHDLNAAIALRLLMSNRKVCGAVSRSPKKVLAQLVLLTKHSILEYQRATTSALGSLTQANVAPRQLLVQAIAHKDGNNIAANEGSAAFVDEIIGLIRRSTSDDTVKRNAALVLANCAESIELRQELARRGAVGALQKVLTNSRPDGGDDDIRYIRDVSRALSCLSNTEESSNNIMQNPEGGNCPIKSLFSLARSADAPTQRNATLTLCNICLDQGHDAAVVEASERNAKILLAGFSKTLTFLCKFPDREIQRLAALSLAGLSLGSHIRKRYLIREDILKVLLRMLRFPDSEIVEGSSLAINSLLLLLRTAQTKHDKTRETELLLDQEDEKEIRDACSGLVGMSHDHLVFCGLYGLGTLLPALDYALVERIVRKTEAGGILTKRAGAYLLGHLCKSSSAQMSSAKIVISCIVRLASLSDPECCECGAFCLAFLSQNEGLRVPLVRDYHAVPPLVAIINAEKSGENHEGRYWAGHALLSLAENYENHLIMGDEGGISALLSLAREGEREKNISLGLRASKASAQLATSML